MGQRNRPSNGGPRTKGHHEFDVPTPRKVTGSTGHDRPSPHPTPQQNRGHNNHNSNGPASSPYDSNDSPLYKIHGKGYSVQGNDIGNVLNSARKKNTNRSSYQPVP
jgi:hypothetical protein